MSEGMAIRNQFSTHMYINKDKSKLNAWNLMLILVCT
jgi:hypothetical protein